MSPEKGGIPPFSGQNKASLEVTGGQATQARQIAQDLARGNYPIETRREFVQDLIDEATLPDEEISAIARLLLED